MAANVRNLVLLLLLTASACAGGCYHLPQSPHVSNSDSPLRLIPRRQARFAELRKDTEPASDTNSADKGSAHAEGNVGLHLTGGTEVGREEQPTLHLTDDGPERQPAPPQPEPARPTEPANKGFVSPPPPEPPANHYNPTVPRPGKDAGALSPAPGVKFGAGASATNTRIRTSPTVTDEDLQLGPGETVASRAVVSARELAATRAELSRLRERVRVLEQQLESRDYFRDEERREFDLATTEMARARTKLEFQNERLLALRDRLQHLEKQDLETLREIVSHLEKLLLESEPKKSTH